MTKQVSKQAQEFFRQEYPNGAIAYRGVRLPKHGKLLKSWASYIDKSANLGNQGQMATITGDRRGYNESKGLSTAIRYCLRLAVPVPVSVFPGGMLNDGDDQIIVMSFRMRSEHVLWNPDIISNVNDHIVLRPELDLSTLEDYREERFSVSSARAKLDQVHGMHR